LESWKVGKLEGWKVEEEEFLVSGFWFQVEEEEFLVSGFWFLVSSFWFQVEEVEGWKVSGFGFRCIRHSSFVTRHSSFVTH
jgi:hypothetical protein